MRNLRPRLKLREAKIVTLEMFCKDYLDNQPLRNYGDVNYVEFGGTQFEITGRSAIDKTFTFYQLTTPDSGFNGWLLEAGEISLMEMFKNATPDTPINQLVFTDKMWGVMKYVGVTNKLQLLYSNYSTSVLKEIIVSILLGLTSYGGYSDVYETWEYQNEYEADDLQIEVESYLKRMRFDLT